MRVKKIGAGADEKKVIQEIIQEVDRLIKDPKETKEREKFVKEAGYLTPEDLMRVFNV
ncbi:MAG: hypothetical protein U9N35_00845 [Euryarchaeota archaeon]|nr:hypothetical protein [Euryarchaeota archaeon]